jgi:antitoxin YefM
MAMYSGLYSWRMVVVGYTAARANLAALMDKAVDDAEAIRITRRGKPDVVLMAADEWEAWKETLYLLRSPANAERLLADIAAAYRGEGTPSTLDELRRDVGLADSD